KPESNGISHRYGLGKAGDVVKWFCAQKETYRRRAIGKGRRDRFETNLRDFVNGERQHIGWKTIAMPGERIDQRAAVSVVVEQHDGIGAAGFTVGQEHRS